MLRRIVLLLLMGVTFLPLLAGCMTTKPVIWSWPHNKRHLVTMLDGFHELHMDIDRIIFDMDQRPVEDID